jgi:hypothetical protein
MIGCNDCEVMVMTLEPLIDVREDNEQDLNGIL